MRTDKEAGCCHDRRAAHYRAADTNDRLIINLRDISHTMRFLFEGKGSQRRILIILSQEGPMTQRALTERLGIRPGSASEVIAKLENAGLLLRSSSEEDRRTADIALTDRGQALAREAAEQRERRHEEMFSCLSEAEKAQLLALLERINADWEHRYREPERERRCRRDEAPSGERSV
ncbi:MAG: MarR family winged helix-turn-helix transcriptional regulator [Oscillospiraceae bacterium]